METDIEISLQNLLKFLCEADTSDTEQEIFAKWISVSEEVPPSEGLPEYFQMIRNIKKSATSKELMQKCCRFVVYCNQIYFMEGLHMDALERYYNEYLLDYAQDSNFASYDADAQMTRNRIENILEAGYISEEDIDFLKVILPDIENNSIREDLKDYIDSIS